jgi:hypothetical protein
LRRPLAELRRWRANYGARYTYRSPNASEAKLVAALDASRYNAELAAWTRFPDQVAESLAFPDGGVVARAFVSPDKTVVAMLLATKPRTVNDPCMLMSFTNAVAYRTQTLPHRVLAAGPSSKVVEVLNAPTLAALLSRHEEHVPKDLVRSSVTSAEDLIEQQQRFHELSTAWRESQDPKTLLGLDAEGIGGGDSAASQRILEALSVELPNARVV